MAARFDLYNSTAEHMSELPSASVDLIITSPPYPMIGMWDECFAAQDPQIRGYLTEKKYDDAYCAMHDFLDRVWMECDRVLKENRYVCINVGDATKNCDGEFRLFSNHSKIISFFDKLGYSVLPDIIWRKPTNSPNKFMGSGMYPAGAYVTYEHEYILIFRKGGKRLFRKESEKIARRQSAYFWEERNVWFSDIWEMKGRSQLIRVDGARGRSAAYPFEVPYRLVNMYSVKGDTVLDPFLGTGTTAAACMAGNRNGVGYEIDPALCQSTEKALPTLKQEVNSYIQSRLNLHRQFIDDLPDDSREKCYKNHHHNFAVKTRQETELKIEEIESIEQTARGIIVSYQGAV